MPPVPKMAEFSVPTAEDQGLDVAPTQGASLSSGFCFEGMACDEVYKSSTLRLGCFLVVFKYLKAFKKHPLEGLGFFSLFFSFFFGFPGLLKKRLAFLD